jgi:enhancing lycopene biosynthesis protein 2
MERKPVFGVLLSGCGVYDGAEIHESVSLLLALAQEGIEARCFAPNIWQHHVVNHLTGEEMPEKRNVLVEAARIARGAIQDIAEARVETLDALLMPGGFGVAKNFTKWAFEGPEGAIAPEVKALIQAFYQAKKPIGAVCMAPTTLAKALEQPNESIQLTIGNTTAASPYDIAAISGGINQTGHLAVMAGVEEVLVDKAHKVVTSPCYMMEADITQIYEAALKTVRALKALL